MKQYKSKIYDIGTIKGMKKAEKKINSLYNLYNSVKTITYDLDKIYFLCQ